MLTVGTTSVHAHDDAYLDTQQSSPWANYAWRASITWNWWWTNQPRRRPKTLVVYVTDHGVKNFTEGAPQERHHPLLPRARPVSHWYPDGDNRPAAPGAMLHPDMEGHHQIHGQGVSPPETARFYPLVKSKEAHMDHNSTDIGACLRFHSSANHPRDMTMTHSKSTSNKTSAPSR